jgi:hypothetical protein
MASAVLAFCNAVFVTVMWKFSELCCLIGLKRLRQLHAENSPERRPWPDLQLFIMHLWSSFTLLL